MRQLAKGSKANIENQTEANRVLVLKPAPVSKGHDIKQLESNGWKKY